MNFNADEFIEKLNLIGQLIGQEFDEDYFDREYWEEYFFELDNNQIVYVVHHYYFSEKRIYKTCFSCVEELVAHIWGKKINYFAKNLINQIMAEKWRTYPKEIKRVNFEFPIHSKDNVYIRDVPKTFLLPENYPEPSYSYDPHELSAFFIFFNFPKKRFCELIEYQETYEQMIDNKEREIWQNICDLIKKEKINEQFGLTPPTAFQPSINPPNQYDTEAIYQELKRQKFEQLKYQILFGKIRTKWTFQPEWIIKQSILWSKGIVCFLMGLILFQNFILNTILISSTFYLKIFAICFLFSEVRILEILFRWELKKDYYYHFLSCVFVFIASFLNSQIEIERNLIYLLLTLTLISQIFIFFGEEK